MFVIMPAEFVLGVAMLVRLPCVGGLIVPVIVGAAIGVAVGVAMLVQMLVGMGMGVGMAVSHVAMAVGMGMDVTVLMGMLMLVLVPTAVIVMMSAMHGRPPGRGLEVPSLAQHPHGGEARHQASLGSERAQ
jgi:hypothetical protein